MTDNRLTAAFGQVADIVEQLRDRGEAVGEQVAGKLTSGVEDAKENAQARLETAQAAFDDAVAQALARFDKAKDRLSVELPEELEELRAKFTPEELRKVAEPIITLGKNPTLANKRLAFDRLRDREIVTTVVLKDETRAGQSRHGAAGPHRYDHAAADCRVRPHHHCRVARAVPAAPLRCDCGRDFGRRARIDAQFGAAARALAACRRTCPTVPSVRAG